MRGWPFLPSSDSSSAVSSPQNVSPPAAVAVQREGKVGTADVVAEQAGGRSGFQLPLELLVNFENLAVDVDVADIRAHDIGGQHHALDQHVRVVLQDVAILEGPRLALVGVAHQKHVAFDLRGNEAPFEPGREARPAAAAQRAELDLLAQLRRLLLPGEHALEHLVAAQSAVSVEIG